MTHEATQPAESPAAVVDAALTEWWQGDIASAGWAGYFANPGLVLTESAIDAVKNGDFEGADAVSVLVEVLGLVIVSQTCDVRRRCADQPFVQVCPLVQLADDQASHARNGHRIYFAHVPGGGENAFADLRHLMTVEKAFLATWPRRPGCGTDEERRKFGRHVGRVYHRFAFPDDFNGAVGKLAERIKKNYKKSTPEGAAIGALDEIRVLASPSWEAEQVDVTLLFALPDSSATGGLTEAEWEVQIRAWVNQCKCHTGTIGSVTGIRVFLDAMSAREYKATDLLDVDYLSP